MKQHKWSRERLANAIADPKWHKAVFYRDPIERFVSGYISKCIPGHDKDRFHCTDAFGKRNATFAEAVAAVSKMDSRTSSHEQQIDVHFKRQSRFCGLDRTLQYYNTVEMLQKNTARAKVTKMLKTVGVNDPEAIDNFDILFPPPGVDPGVQRDEENPFGAHNPWLTKAHNSNSEKQAQRFLNDSVAVAALVDHYVEDYLLFGIQAPGWVVKHMLHRPPHRTHFFRNRFLSPSSPNA
jgi:hypothetical protein